MAAHGAGKWQQFVANLRATPGDRQLAGTDLGYNVITQLRHYGAEVDYTISTPRRTSGKQYDLYRVYAWWPDPQNELTAVENQLALARTAVHAARLKAAEEEMTVKDAKRAYNSAQARLRARRQDVMNALKESDRIHARYNKLVEQVKLDAMKTRTFNDHQDSQAR